VTVAAALLALLLSIRAIADRQFRTRGNSTAACKPLSVLIGIALWLALFESGFDPVVSGLLIGLLTNAYEPRTEWPAAVFPNHRLQRRAALSLSWAEPRGTALSACIGFTVSLLGQAKVGILATALLAPAR
jgi:hypothetical protein